MSFTLYYMLDCNTAISTSVYALCHTLFSGQMVDNGIRAAKVILSLVTEKYAKSANCNKEVC